MFVYVRVRNRRPEIPEVNGFAAFCCCWHSFLAWRRLSHPEEFSNVKFLIFLQTVAALFPL